MSVNWKRHNTEDFPCSKERGQSMKCLQDNNYDYSKCKLAFENFKFCNSFWDRVAKLRSSYKIQPALPDPEERAEIYQLFKTTGELPNYSKNKE